MTPGDLLRELRQRWSRLGARIGCGGARARPATCQAWLRAAGYADVADRIDELEERWRRNGSTTRRNWWDVLAGTKAGARKKVGGVEFPILAAARARKGWGVLPGALRKRNEPPAPAGRA